MCPIGEPRRPLLAKRVNAPQYSAHEPRCTEAWTSDDRSNRLRRRCCRVARQHEFTIRRHRLYYSLRRNNHGAAVNVRPLQSDEKCSGNITLVMQQQLPITERACFVASRRYSPFTAVETTVRQATAESDAHLDGLPQVRDLVHRGRPTA